MKLLWTSRAKTDLIGIGRFIARDKPGAARRWVEKIRQRARDTAHVPFAGRIVPEVERDDVREVFLGNYRIVYLVSEKYITVLTVFEGHRRFPEKIIECDDDSKP